MAARDMAAPMCMRVLRTLFRRVSGLRGHIREDRQLVPTDAGSQL